MAIRIILVWHSGCICDISGRHYGASASPVNRVNVGTASAPPQVRGRAPGTVVTQSAWPLFCYLAGCLPLRFSIEGVRGGDCRADGAVNSRAVEGGARQVDAAAVQPQL